MVSGELSRSENDSYNLRFLEDTHVSCFLLSYYCFSNFNVFSMKV